MAARSPPSSAAMTRGLFITGTDTGVGKTRIGCALAHLLGSRGETVCVRKPVESGCLDGVGGRFAKDAAALRLAAGGREALDVVCPYRLYAHLSPERAALLEGIAMSVDDLAAACRAGVGEGDFALVEGAGGFYSPTADHAHNAHLADRLQLPVLIVAADRLGAINHTLLTVEAARSRGLRVVGVVLNQINAPRDAEMDNRGELARWLDVPVWRVPVGVAAGPEAWRRESALLAPLADLLLKQAA